MGTADWEFRVSHGTWLLGDADGDGDGPAGLIDPAVVPDLEAHATLHDARCAAIYTAGDAESVAVTITVHDHESGLPPAGGGHVVDVTVDVPSGVLAAVDLFDDARHSAPLGSPGRWTLRINWPEIPTEDFGVEAYVVDAAPTDRLPGVEVVTWHDAWRPVPAAAATDGATVTYGTEAYDRYLRLLQEPGMRVENHLTGDATPSRVAVTVHLPDGRRFDFGYAEEHRWAPRLAEYPPA